MSKIIFFDIDGTLHYSGIGIPQSAVKAINQLIANGHKAVMCTGRSKGMMPEEYFHMGFHGMILGAGAYVEYEGKVIHRELMTKQEVQTVIDWGKKQKIGIILEGEQHGYYDPDNHDDYYVAMKNKTEVDCETTLYPISEAVDVAKWTYHRMILPFLGYASMHHLLSICYKDNILWHCLSNLFSHFDHNQKRPY